MRILLTLGTAAALVVVAACSRGEDATGESGNAVANGSAGNRSSAVPPAAEKARSPEEIATLMHDRHENFEEMGDAFKAINRELKGHSPDLAVVRRHAETIGRFAPQVQTWFPAGSGPETGRRTRAKAEIWQDRATFDQRARAFATAGPRYLATVQGDDIAAIRAATAELGNVCKNCHDRFRAPEDSRDH